MSNNPNQILMKEPELRETPYNKFENLTLDDIEFYERVSESITSSHALPFEIPVDSFFRIVLRCLKFHWEWNPEATIEVSYFLPLREIKPHKKGTGYQIKFPFNIENVFGLHEVNSVSNTTVTNFLRWNMLQTYTSNSGGSNYRGGYKQAPTSMSNITIQLYEFENYRELFQRSIHGTFNNNKSVLTVRSEINTDLVVDVFERVLPEDLYADYTFEEHVTAMVEEQLGRIVTAFDFPLIGDVKINYDQIKERGIEKRKEIEDGIKEIGSNHDFIFFK